MSLFFNHVDTAILAARMLAKAELKDRGMSLHLKEIYNDEWERTFKSSY